MTESTQSTTSTKTAIWRSFRSSLKAQLSVAILLTIVLSAIFAPQVAPHDPEKQDLTNSLQPPVGMEGGEWEHPLGTNNLGQDILSQIIFGARISLFVGFLGAALSAAVGVPVALIAGYYGGAVDEILMRFADVFLSIPVILLAVAVVSIFKPNPYNVVLVFVFVSWAWLARTVRAEVLSTRRRGFIEASEAMGASDFRIITKHIFPNVLSTILVITTLYVAIIILYQASLSFLGLASTLSSWGWQLAVGRKYITTAWWLATFPGLAIFVTVMTLNLLGDWLRDTVDVKTDQ